MFGARPASCRQRDTGDAARHPSEHPHQWAGNPNAAPSCSISAELFRPSKSPYMLAPIRWLVGGAGLSIVADEFFPDSQRVFYAKAPLKQVVCQVRFPALFRIENEVPSAFQEKIRTTWPLSARSDPFALPVGVPSQLQAFSVGL